MSMFPESASAIERKIDGEISRIVNDITIVITTRRQDKNPIT
jgi:hypothetical protein